MYSPPLCEAVLGLTVYLRLDAQIPARTRELAVIATARERDCPYVWAAHAPAAHKEGVSDETIAAVRDGAALESGSSEGDVVELVRQLMRSHRVEQSRFDRLIAEHSLPGLVELCAVIGHYLCVTTLLNAFEVAPAEGAEALPLG
jgi:AhpD family alkylhydroperoxidase